MIGRTVASWTRLSLLTRSLLVVFVVNSVLGSVFLAACCTTWNQTAMDYAWNFLAYPLGGTRRGADSWHPMVMAWEALKATPDVLVYSKVFFTDHIKFQYPTSSLLGIELLNLLPDLSWRQTIDILDSISWVAGFGIALVTAVLLRNAAVPGLRVEGSHESRVDRALTFLAVLLLAVTFYPIARSWRLGQLQTIITLLSAGTLLAWQRGWTKTAGFLIGVTCTLKPHWGVLLVWAGLRRQFAPAIVGAVTALTLVGVSVLLYGIQQYFDYLPVLGYLTHHGEGYFPNQSVNGLMNRLLHNGNNLEWVSIAFPNYHPAVFAATIISSIALMGGALLWRWKDPEGAGTAGLALAMLSITMAAPVAWEHHYGVLFPIFAIAAPLAVARRPFGKWTLPFLAVAYGLTSHLIQATDRFADTWLNFLQSYLFFGAVMVLVLLYRMIGRSGAAEAGAA